MLSRWKTYRAYKVSALQPIKLQHSDEITLNFKFINTMFNAETHGKLSTMRWIRRVVSDEGDGTPPCPIIGSAERRERKRAYAILLVARLTEDGGRRRSAETRK